jgi:hypothetical protein
VDSRRPSRLAGVLDTTVVAALIGVFLLVSGYSSLMVARLVRITADPRRDDGGRPTRRTPRDD